MSEQSFTDEEGVPDTVAIESKLPLNAIDIESQKDMESGRYHALRSLHKWFAARPTPAVRLAVLASVYPGEIDSDELLRLMQIGPKELESGLAEFVESKYSDEKGSGTIDDHYGYPNPNTQSPTKTEIANLQKTLREAWGGDLPTILDPTAGRGIIPFEAIRYGLPARANELNPVPSLILKAGLEYAPEVGSLDPDIWEWRDKIHEMAKENIEPYFPTEEPDRQILNSALTYIIRCDSCQGEIPLVSKWWLNKDSDGGDAIKPSYEDGTVEYQHIRVEDQDSSYDPEDAPLRGRDAECPHCGVVNEKGEIQEKIHDGDFEYSIYGVNFETKTGERGYRAGSEVDQKGLEKASKRIENDFDMLTFLSEPVDVSSRTNDPTSYGMDEWRDIFTPRQLVVQYEFLSAFEEYKPQILKKYESDKAQAILTVLTLAASRSMYYNTRLNQWHDLRGYGSHLFSDNNLSFKRMSVDNNLAAPRRGYQKHSEHVIDSYETLVTYVEDAEPAEIASLDAANLTSHWEAESVDAAIVDPPYYSSIMYAELSDVFYVLQKEYLSDTYPELYSSGLTDKDNEAVANPYRFEDIADDEQSKDDLADEHYESKMEDIFAEVQELLSPGGVMTVMFTHREMDAWDTLTSALISAGFTITATHPIKTEMSDRVGVQGKASADSSIFLVARKEDTQSTARTLWEDVQDDIRQAARNQAEEILDSGYNISKTDTAIAAYGPTLQKYAEEYPVVNKKGEEIRPREALSQAREAVTGVLAERFLKTDGIEQIDSLSRWYILSWLIYENDTIPYDEARQLGVAANVDIDNIKRPTKIWGKSGKDIQLKDHTDRVQDIVILKSDSADNPSSRKYPVNPTDTRFTYNIDAVHSAIHVYEREGARAAWQWLSDRNLKSNQEFEVTITALLEVLPAESNMRETLINLVSGETGDYLDINLSHIDMTKEGQTELSDHQ
jgi:adenine-specific DNA methylase